MFHVVGTGELEPCALYRAVRHFFEWDAIAIIVLCHGVVADGVITAKQSPTPFFRAVLIGAMQRVAVEYDDIARIQNTVHDVMCL